MGVLRNLLSPFVVELIATHFGLGISKYFYGIDEFLLKLECFIVFFFTDSKHKGRDIVRYDIDFTGCWNEIEVLNIVISGRRHELCSILPFPLMHPEVIGLLPSLFLMVFDERL